MGKAFPHLHILGITGEIGSGKSTVASVLKKKGWETIDCDEIVHKLYQPEGSGTQKIKTFFGETYLTKEEAVSRKKLLRILVKSPKKWEILNRMIHPLVAEQLMRELRKVKGKKVAIEIQIYNERLFSDFIDQLWKIQSTRENQFKRINKRKLSLEEFESMRNQQKSGEEIKSITIENNGDKKKLEQTVLEKLKELD